ncbi:MAG: DUF4476 domain-containing protein [Bacteroidia bacterium]|nr:DUF4476 domain-containing protein [Bacteroidia bacterium]MDW8333177.1 DUF4476 domain-containing protein [Bacteroidia bacterium]
MYRWIGALIMAVQTATAQPSAIAVVGETGDIFRVSLNNAPTADCFSDKAYFDDLLPGPYRLNVEVYQGRGRIVPMFQDLTLPPRSELQVRLTQDRFGRYTLLTATFPRGGPTTTPGLPRPGGPATQPPPSPPPAPNPLPGYNGPIGCPNPVSAETVNAALNSIRNAPFRDSKINIAKQFLSANCVLTRDVLEIMRRLDFDEDRLEIATFAYPSTYDQGNYFMLNDGFTFQSTREDFNDFMRDR